MISKQQLFCIKKGKPYLASLETKRYQSFQSIKTYFALVHFGDCMNVLLLLDV